MDEETNEGVGALDFFDTKDRLSPWTPTLESVEKWWCVGDSRNRADMWVQGAPVYPAENRA